SDRLLRMQKGNTQRFPRGRIVAICAVLVAGTTVTSAQTQSVHDRFEIKLVLPASDSMIATVPQSRCGPLRLVLLGPAQFYTIRGMGQSKRFFRIPLALGNAGTGTFPASLAMPLDSAAPVQYGRQLNASYSLGFMSEFGRMGGAKTGLRPGERSRG